MIILGGALFLFKKIKQGYKKFDHQTIKLQNQLYQWHGFKLFIAVVTTLYVVELVDLTNDFFDWLFNIVSFALVFLLFHEPKGSVQIEDTSTPPIKSFAWVGQKVSWLNQQMFGWYSFKLFLGYFSASMWVQNNPIESWFIRVVSAFLIFSLVGLFYIDPKRAHRWRMKN